MIQNTMIRIAKDKDLDLVVNILLEAKNKMYENNIHQWPKHYPNKEIVIDNIKKGIVYILDDVATITLDPMPQGYFSDINNYIKDNYLTIHRVAVANSAIGKGYGYKMFELAKEVALNQKKDSIMVDTHIENFIMQRLIEKNNYKYIGLVAIKNSGQRLAFQYVIQY